MSCASARGLEGSRLRSVREGQTEMDARQERGRTSQSDPVASCEFPHRGRLRAADDPFKEKRHPGSNRPLYLNLMACCPSKLEFPRFPSHTHIVVLNSWSVPRWNTSSQPGEPGPVASERC